MHLYTDTLSWWMSQAVQPQTTHQFSVSVCLCMHFTLFCANQYNCHNLSFAPNQYMQLQGGTTLQQTPPPTPVLIHVQLWVNPPRGHVSLHTLTERWAIKFRQCQCYTWHASHQVWWQLPSCQNSTTSWMKMRTFGHLSPAVRFPAAWPSACI